MKPISFAPAAVLLALAGCGPAAVQEIPFAAVVAAQSFSCASTYSLGSPATQYTPRDFRLYVSDVKLGTASGKTVPFSLTDDGIWQGGGVALLDFEDKQAGCSNGTEATNTRLVGTAPADTYTTLTFTLGVPFSQNHQDATVAAPPLNSSAMFWNWMGGYKFLKIDGTTTGLPGGHNLHVGSTGCMAGSTPNSVQSCANGNRAVITVPFDPSTDEVVLDLAQLLGGANLDTNMAMSAPGCMSAPTDVDCTAIFPRLGLAFGATPAGTQVFASAQPR